jgi:RNA ligase (TIGR02306 family)
MSTFNVSLRKIAGIRDHPNADRLSLAQVEGMTYQFVTGRDEFRPGDEVLFFPPDALLPEGVVAALGLGGKLAGKEKNRVKTIRLRGEISQGIVARPEKFFPGDSWRSMDDGSITAALGVTKYEPPPVPCREGTLVRMPEGVPAYDIEGADSYPLVVDLLLDQPVHLSEKLEGSNYWASLGPDGALLVGQRNHGIEPVEGAEHDFHRVTREQGLDALARAAAASFPGRRVSLRGEFIGPSVQKNIYRLKANEVRLFDILVGREYLPPERFLEFCARHGALTVPTISIGPTLREWLAGRSLREASNGRSALADTAREGIVVKPLVEGSHPDIGRLLIKQRSPDYLAASDF